MSFDPKPGTYYRMPVFFGPTPGPRQWPQDEPFDPADQTATMASVNFLTRAQQLEPFLPPGFALWDEPVATLDITWMRNIPWLAGRGYAMSDFKVPAIYQGAEGPVHGVFVLVRWESLADPILSGRDELGHNKLYCEIPDLTDPESRPRTSLSWLGHVFAELELWDLEPAAPAAPDPLDQGQLHFKWVPRTGHPGEADAAYATLSPPPTAPGAVTLLDHRTGQGSFRYKPTRWRDFPFCHRVISAIAELDQLEPRGASLTRTKGSVPTPGSNTRIVQAAGAR